MRAKKLYSDAQFYINKNSLFMPKEIHQKFDSLMSVVWELITSKEVDLQMRHNGGGHFNLGEIREKSKKVQDELGELERILRDRLATIEKA